MPSILAVQHQRPWRVDLAPVTGPLHHLAGRRILVLADDENLRISARDLGRRLSYRALGEVLRHSAPGVYLHAVFSSLPGDRTRADGLRRRGWTPHVREARMVPSWHGPRLSANADFYIAFLAGRLAARLPCDALVIGSGDGELVEEIASAVRRGRRARPVFTLSLPGSTSRRLDARTSSLIEANLEIGLDCLRPLSFRESRHAGA